MKKFKGNVLLFSLCILATGQVGAMDDEATPGVTFRIEQGILKGINSGRMEIRHRQYMHTLNFISPAEVRQVLPGAFFDASENVYLLEANNPNFRRLLNINYMRVPSNVQKAAEQLDECLSAADSLNRARALEESTLPHTLNLASAIANLYSSVPFAEELLQATGALCTAAAAGDPRKIFEGATATAGKR